MITNSKHLLTTSPNYRATLRLALLLPALAMALAACVLPGATTPVPVDTQTATLQPNPAYTAAAQTIIAQLTALSPSATPLAAASPDARPTIAPSPELSAEAPANDTPTSVATPSVEVVAAETSTPEAVPTLEPSQTPTNPPQPSQTPASNDMRARLGEPDWRDSFANANNWPLFEDEHVHFRLRDGGLQLLAKQPEKWDGWMLSWTTLFNFYLEVTASPQNCSGADRYGLLARAPDAEKAYLFGFTCDGQYSLRKWDGKRYTYLVDWTASSLIQKGQGKTNRLGFMASGDQISLFANGEPLTEISDRSYDNGAFGLFISSTNTQDFTVMVTEVAYWELP